MLLEEPGGDEVAELLPRTRISAVNLAEALGRLARDGVPDEALADVEARLRPLAVPFEAGLTAETARLIRVARGLSLGDRACIATAKHLGLPAITADKVWAKLDLGVEVRPIR
ncbi:MAG: type II toxin-antitoxin system VapC family toxin [Acetobacteraceae bacterium]|nr:type II toxin-antitoxin system VapC family toxin [Acetobacteraceae bacterium]